MLREEVDLLELPLVEVVSAALGDGARERWDTNTAGELIVLLAAMAELKAKVLLGEDADEEPDPDALEARELLAARLVAYAPSSGRPTGSPSVPVPVPGPATGAYRWRARPRRSRRRRTPSSSAPPSPPCSWPCPSRRSRTSTPAG